MPNGGNWVENWRVAAYGDGQAAQILEGEGATSRGVATMGFKRLARGEEMGLEEVHSA